MISTCGSHMVFTSVKATAAEESYIMSSTTKGSDLSKGVSGRSGYKRLSSAIKTWNVSMLMSSTGKPGAADKETVLVWTSESSVFLGGEGQVETQMELNGYIYLSFNT